MVQSWWALAVTMVGVGGVGYLGWALTRAIWTGRPPRRVPLSASILVALATAHILSGQRADPAPTLVAAASVSQPSIAQPSCLMVRGTTAAPRQSGERVTLTGTDQLRSDCGLWAIIVDPRTGERWAQGPALLSSEGWSLTVVLGTGQAAGPLSYSLDIFAFEPDVHGQLQRTASTISPLEGGTFPRGRDEQLRSVTVAVNTPE